MLNLVCRELNNYFEVDKQLGSFKIEDGILSPLDRIQTGQYFRIIGSIFNDGIYKFPATNLKDESFEGAVWLLAIPQEVIALADEINSWQEKNSSVVSSPFTSESFGGYSYSKPDGSNSGWQSAFAKRLNTWRKI